ncbi:hypothetical protein K501DRAFT_74822 [Backusella circina FSU 941]|nr:hypothetical protein K501DRAFT_74822 [Backusella circina FSU 941]
MVAPTSLNKTMILMLPLDSIFDVLPPNHWAIATPCCSLWVAHFFRFDRSITCLELISQYDTPLFPGLARRLQRDFYQETLRISPLVQAIFILSDEYPGNFGDHPLFDRFLEVSTWSTYNSRQFGLKQTILLLDHTPTISFLPASWLFFWKISIAPEARSL